MSSDFPPSPPDSPSPASSPLAGAGAPRKGGPREEGWNRLEPQPPIGPLPNSRLGAVVSAVGYLIIGLSLIYLVAAFSDAAVLMVAGSLFISGLGLLATAEVLHRLVDICYSLRRMSGRRARDLDPNADLDAHLDK